MLVGSLGDVGAVHDLRQRLQRRVSQSVALDDGLQGALPVSAFRDSSTGAPGTRAPERAPAIGDELAGALHLCYNPTIGAAYPCRR